MNLDDYIAPTFEEMGINELPESLKPKKNLLSVGEFLEAVLTPPGEEPTAIIFVISKFKEAYDLKKLLKSKLEETQKSLDSWEEALLEKFNEEGVEKITTGQGTFYTREDTYASYDHDREPETFAWLREEGEGSIIKETINARTLAAWVKERKENEAEIPDFFSVTLKRKIGVRSK
jgi:hypothetical protein